MKKKIFGLLLSMSLLSFTALPVCAETSYGDPNWGVTFTADKEMESNFKSSNLDEAIYGLQPGDNAVITVALKNEYDTNTSWYMTNEVLYSLEDRSNNDATGGGAYTYILTYTDHEGVETTLYDSSNVGGDDEQSEGLHEATDSLEDYFYLDSLTRGEAGKVTLEVALDGETQGNDYQDTLADLQMNFAVELDADVPPGTPPGTTPPATTTDLVKTGDEINQTPFFIAAVASGCLFLILFIVSIRERRKEKKRRAEV